MCGRYALENAGLIPDRFHVDEIRMARLEKFFNLAPSEGAPVIVNDGGKRVVEEMRFGLIPAWSKTGKLDMSTINARAESVHEKPAFREGFRRHRCLVPADGYYEWKPVGKKKVPHHISMKDGGLFAFAGVFDEWKGMKETIRSFSIITTRPNDLSPDFLDRMPAILLPGDEDRWLMDENPLHLAAFLKPYPTDRMRLRVVSSAVNDARCKGPECLAKPEPEEPDLFGPGAPAQ